MYLLWYTMSVAEATRTSRLGPVAVSREGKRIPAIFFRTKAGREPVREWLRSLPYSEDRKRIGQDIKTVEFGWPVGMPASGWRNLRGADGSWAESNRPDLVLCGQERPDGPFAWVHKEDAADVR